MDVEEAGAMNCFVAAGAELQRTQVAPEADAYTFAKIAGNERVTGNQQDLSAATAEELLSELRFATNLMDEKQVDSPNWLKKPDFNNPTHIPRPPPQADSSPPAGTRHVTRYPKERTSPASGPSSRDRFFLAPMPVSSVTGNSKLICAGEMACLSVTRPLRASRVG